jgi:hypothetical protein
MHLSRRPGTGVERPASLRAWRPARGSLEGTIVKQTYRVVSGLIALGVLVQAADVALGWFSAIHDLDNGRVIDENYDGNAGHVLHGSWASTSYRRSG